MAKKGSNKSNEKDAKSGKKSDEEEVTEQGEGLMRKSKAAAGEMIRSWRNVGRRKEEGTSPHYYYFLFVNKFVPSEFTEEYFSCISYTGKGTNLAVNIISFLSHLSCYQC